MKVRIGAAVLGWALGTLAPSLSAESDPATPTESVKPATSATATALEPPLEPLPNPPSRTLPPPSPRTIDVVRKLLDRLHDPDPASRAVALAELRHIDESLLSAISQQIDREAEGADRKAMKRLLLDIRRDARDAIEKKMRAEGKKGEVETPDYLEMLVEYGRPDSETWRRLVNVLALSRMCVHLKSVEAVRTLIKVYVRFDFLRIDTQLQIKKLGDHALAGLIETTKYPAHKIATWAARQLDFLGKAIAGEAVQVDDPELLADILRAYGYTKDPDAARLVISFSNSERSQIREAARQAVVMMGEVANWQLRDTYENMVGKKPAREWTWERTAQELFREFDRIRLAELYGFFQEAQRAQQAGDWKAMKEAYDQVLTRDPEFTPRDEMLKGYLAFAEEYFAEDPEAVSTALLRIQRLSTDDTEKARAESLLLTLQAKQQVASGLAERSLLERALELDPSNRYARSLLKEVRQEPVTEQSSFLRLLWPALLGVLAALSILVIAWRRPRTMRSRSN